MILEERFQKFPAALVKASASSYDVENVGRKVRLFLWSAVLFTESAMIYSVLLLVHIHHWV